MKPPVLSAGLSQSPPPPLACSLGSVSCGEVLPQPVKMVAQAPLIADVLDNNALHGAAAASRSAFVSETDRFADLRAGSYYAGNAATSTTRPFLMPHKATQRANVGPTAYFPKDTQLRPRTTSPDFSKRRGRGLCFDMTKDQKTTEFIFRTSNWSLQTDAQHWVRGGSKFPRASERRATRKAQKSTGLLFNPDRGGQGGGKYQSMASSASAGRTGSPQKYSAAFRGTGREDSSRKRETSKARRERECRERLGPGTYSAPSADQLSCSKSKARFSPVFMPAGRAAHDTTPASNTFTPGPGQYDAANVWKEKVAPRAARGEVRLALAPTTRHVVGSGQPVPSQDSRTRVPFRGEGTWSLQTDAREWRKRSGSPVGAFSTEQRLTLDTTLSYRDAINQSNASVCR